MSEFPLAQGYQVAIEFLEVNWWGVVYDKNWYSGVLIVLSAIYGFGGYTFNY